MTYLPEPQAEAAEGPHPGGSGFSAAAIGGGS
jgi:hypothetical protein